tara:strand:- start:1241 stop:1555 length:315 start_codon:yes stop_codon:yes gene_type:complete
MFSIIRPDLATKTQQLYERELKLLYQEYSVDDPLTLVEMLNDLTIESKKIKHLFLTAEGQNRNLRVAVYRNLIDFFKDLIDFKIYNKIDTIILEYRIESQNNQN